MVRWHINAELVDDHEVKTVARTPIHPGEILAEELEVLGISALALANALHVPADQISQLLSGKQGITADTALRLSQYLGTTPEFWLNLQRSYESKTLR